MKSNAAVKFRKVSGGSNQQIDAFVSPNDLDEGQELQGYYRGSPIMGQYNNPVHKIELTQAATLKSWDKATEKLQKTKFAVGALIGLNSAGMLNKAFGERIQEGALVQVIYTGKQKIAKGPRKGKDAHTFEIGVADDTSKTDSTDTEEDLNFDE